MRWAEMVAGQPKLGEIARERLLGPGVVLVGTQRRDGTARVSGVEPLVMEGDLWLSMMNSLKVLDLRRDPRLLVRSVLTKPAGEMEILLRGTARLELAEPVQARYAEAAAATLGWRPVVGQFTLFRVEIEDVSYIGFDPDTGAQHVARWPAGVEYVRSTITPTHYGPRQAVSRLLVRPQ
ncbi:MAG: hypothetical protein ACREQM_08505 [Candidatus Dormibacteraceae bacterium]